jgi:putative ABC transport system permease protein
VEAVRTAINELKFPDGRSARVHAETVRDYAKSAMHLRVSRAMAMVTSAIAVFVGAIGILNTMIMSVVERIREISLLRAIGWKRSRVTRMVVGESVTLSLLGSVVGVVAAYLLIQLLTRIPETAGLVDGQMAWHVVTFGVAMAAVVGLIGGIYPALRAANLPPSHGLRAE